MDFSFHIQQGRQLLEKQEASAIRKALGHFKAANEMTEDEDIAKPKTLYHLALGNLMIGNIEQSYKIAYKAKRSIDGAIENSMISMGNMRHMLGEGDIDELINHINEKYPQIALSTDIEDEEFDENELDFSLLDKLYQTIKKQEVKPQFSIDSLRDEVIGATFMGLSRTDDELIYFDKLKGDVLSHVQGYFSSHIGDQSAANRRLANRITNNEPIDFVDEDRYILIDRLPLTHFLNEYKKNTNGKEPFLSFAEYFSIEILKDFTYDDDLTIDDLTNSSHMQNRFHELFGEKFQNRVLELKGEYTNIFENTCRSLAVNWIETKILNNMTKDQPSGNANNSFNFHKEHLHKGHMPIVAYFKQHGFGTNNPVLTYFSVLATTERCVILEELYNPQVLDSILSDKLLLAYVTSGKIELAKKVIENSIKNGESDLNVWGLNSKLDLGLAPKRNREQRLAIYNDFLSKTQNPLEVKFLNLLVDFCNNYYE